MSSEDVAFLLPSRPLTSRSGSNDIHNQSLRCVLYKKRYCLVRQLNCVTQCHFFFPLFEPPVIVDMYPIDRVKMALIYSVK